MTYVLPVQARELVLFQRTEFLPPKTISSRLKKLFMGGGGIESFESRVRSYAKEHGEVVDSKYFSTMRGIYQEIAPYIPIGTRNILDIGCGVAGLDLFLYKNLDSPNIILLDKTKVEDKIWYSFKDDGAFYNSLAVAEGMLVQNGVPPEKVTSIEAESGALSVIPDGSVDCVISTISWGFHYPVETYLSQVVRVMSDEGVLILDLRKNTNGLELIKSKFTVQVIAESKKSLRVAGTLRKL